MTQTVEEKLREQAQTIEDMSGAYQFGWHDSDAAGAAAKRGLSEEVVRGISAIKNEPEWMLERRLKGLELFEKKPTPTWGPDLSEINYDQIKYFVRSTDRQAQSWDDLPEDIRETYDRLGIPEAEKARLVAGVAARTSPRSSTTRSTTSWPSKASSSSTPTRACASTKTCSRNTSARWFRSATTSSPR